MKLHELLTKIKFDYDTDVNAVLLYTSFGTAPYPADDYQADVIIFSTELHKQWEMFKYLNSEVLKFKDNYTSDPEFSSRVLEVWICL